MKRPIKSTFVRLSRWLLSLMGLSLALAPTGSVAADDQTSPGSNEPAVLTPEQYFEGGTNSYDNWIALAAGGYLPNGNTKQFQQDQRTQDDVFGGIEDFHYQRDLGKDFLLRMDGRAIFNNDDYKLSLDLRKPELGYLKLDYTEFRTWYNGDGGYYPPAGAWYPLGDKALALDRGELSFEAGLTLENLPEVKFRYTHRFRQGQKSSTIWGSVFPEGPFGPERKLSPAFYDIDERADIFELDLTHQIKATDLGVGARYEMGNLDNTFNGTATDAVGTPQPTTDHQGTAYDLLNVHAFTETWIRKNVFLSSGFLFSDLDNNASGYRNSAPGLSYTSLNGGARAQEYTLNLNLMTVPWTHFSIVPAVRVQGQDWDADSSGVAAQFFSANSDRNALDVRERLDLRYNGVTNWVFYARGEWTQGQGKLNENGGMEVTGQPPVMRETDDDRFFQKYVAGLNWYPVRKVSVDGQFYYRNNAYDYDHVTDSTTGTSAGGFYPAQIITQGLQTYDANVRLTLRPSPRVTLVTRYDFQYNTINTEPEAIAGVGNVETSQTTTHMIAQNINWTPWSRLFLQVGFNYVLSDTHSPVSDYTQSVLNAQNNYWTLNFSSGFVLTDKTDLSLGYFFYQADDYQDNSTQGVPYGAGATEHGVTCGITHRLRENIRLNLRYGFARYEDEPSGGNLNYDSHLIYASMQYRF